MNGNHTRIDIWLIYKCSKCETTLKLTIDRGIKPHDISSEFFEGFTNNDVNLAWKYAFDRNFLHQNNCVVQYANVKYHIQGFEPQKWDSNTIIHLKSKYFFDLKLSVVLSGIIGISISKLKNIVDLISVSPTCDIIKYRIKSDIELFIQPLEKILN